MPFISSSNHLIKYRLLNIKFSASHIFYCLYYASHLNSEAKYPPLQQIICEKLCKRNFYANMRKILNV